MVENSLWAVHSMLSPTCWNFGGMGRKDFECPSKKNEATNYNPNQNQNQARGKWSVGRNCEPNTNLYMRNF